MDGPDKGGADWQQQMELEEYLQWVDQHGQEESKPKQAPVKPDHADGDCPF